MAVVSVLPDGRKRLARRAQAAVFVVSLLGGCTAQNAPPLSVSIRPPGETKDVTPGEVVAISASPSSALAELSWSASCQSGGPCDVLKSRSDPDNFFTAPARPNEVVTVRATAKTKDGQQAVATVTYRVREASAGGATSAPAGGQAPPVGGGTTASPQSGTSALGSTSSAPPPPPPPPPPVQGTCLFPALSPLAQQTPSVVTITDPADGSTVPERIDVRFTVEGTLPPGHVPALVIEAPNVSYWGWPAVRNEPSGSSTWVHRQVQIGVARDSGCEFTLTAVMTNEPVPTGELQRLPIGPSHSIRVVRQ